MGIKYIKSSLKWMKVWKTLPVYSWIKGAELYRERKYRQAIPYYERGLRFHKNHPASFCARLDLAHCLFSEGQVFEAEKHLKSVIAKIPTSKEASLRLAKLELWSGRSLDAAWTLRRALREHQSDQNMLGLFLYAILDNKGPKFLLEEGLELVKQLETRGENILLEAVLAKHLYDRNKSIDARNRFLAFIEKEELPVEVYIMAAELYYETREILKGRDILRASLERYPDHPRVLSLLAETYLKSGTVYNASYAKQLAERACQKACWLSPREMHVLAEAYYHLDDKMSALIVASKAKEEGSRLLGSYSDSDNLERLIEDLSVGTQA